MRLALIQLEIESGKPELNIRRVAAKIKEASAKRPDVLILPELWNVGYSLKNLAETADRGGVPAAKALGKLAAEYQVNIVAGSVADIREEKAYNTSYIFDRTGTQTAAYSKIHMFGLMEEGLYLSPGLTKMAFDLDEMRCGIIICYDLRFPELSRALALDGAKLIFVPAQWPAPRIYPWRTLLQARAMENQLFLVGVNCVGKVGETRFFGHSMVVSPLGEVLAEGAGEEEIIYVDIDPGEVDRTRDIIDYSKDRRPEAY